MGMFDELEPLSYCVDVAILIDATESMVPIIDKVKANAMDFCVRFHEIMDETERNIDEFRVKVISFRDYAYDGALAMEDSGFFFLPDKMTNSGVIWILSRLKVVAMELQVHSSNGISYASNWTTKGDRSAMLFLCIQIQSDLFR